MSDDLVERLRRRADELESHWDSDDAMDLPGNVVSVLRDGDEWLAERYLRPAVGEIERLREELGDLQEAAARVVEKHDPDSIYSFREQAAAISDLREVLAARRGRTSNE